MRWVFYVDLDAYYVSCERRERPELEGRPVIVGPDPKLGPTRGVVLSASYEARANGVQSAMPAARAAQLCPEAIWVAPDFARYGRVAEEVRAFLARRFDRVVPMSIDEASMVAELPDDRVAEARALALQSEMRRELGLPCSVGVAPSRTVAKIATDEAKPGGIRVVAPEAVVGFLAPLSVRAIPGVGPKTELLLRELGVQRIGELRSLPPAVRRRLGRFGEELYKLALGETGPEEDEGDRRGPRSRSADRTLDRDTDAPDHLAAVLEELARELAGGLAQERIAYASVSVAIRWEDFTRTQRSRALPARQTGVEALIGTSHRILEGMLRKEHDGRARRVRTLSVGVERLTESVGPPPPLESFAPPVK